MEKHFGENYKGHIPVPVYDEHPEYAEIYEKAWQLAFEHIKTIPGMPQSPYMDEAFCKTQIWIWDTCFMSLFCKYASDIFPGVESFDNFYGPLYDGKKLPVVTVPEDEPAWTKAEPGSEFGMQINILDNPPLFAWAEYENALLSGDEERIRGLLYDRKVLQKHYDRLESLNESERIDGIYSPTHWKAEKCGYKWEGGCSGMDNTPRGRIGEHALMWRPNNPDMLWIDAICQQALSAKMISRLFALLGDDGEAEKWMQKFDEKKKIVNDLYLDEKEKFYYDIDCSTHEKYRIMSIASYWALTAEIADKDVAQAMIAQFDNPETLGGKVPFLSLSRSDNDYDPTGKYWRGGVWLPTAYAALKGMDAYGYHEETRKNAAKLLDHMYKTYKEFEPHTFWESYSPEEYKPCTAEDGERLSRKDFCGWSALGPISVYIEFILGFRSVNAFEKRVVWEKPNVKGKVGIKNLRFGDIVTDILADGNDCRVTANREYTLEINGRSFEIAAGENVLKL